jgi:hypothetical protein
MPRFSRRRFAGTGEGCGEIPRRAAKAQELSRYVHENTRRISKTRSAPLVLQRYGLCLPGVDKQPQGQRKGLALREQQGTLKCKNEATMLLKTKGNAWVRFPERTHL